MTNRQWVTLHYFFARQFYQSYLPCQPTASEWHCIISLPGNLINHISHDQQRVSNTACFFIRWQSHQSCPIPWPTVCEWHSCFISFPGSVINHGSSHDQLEQDVSDTLSFLCQAVSLIMSHPMTNSMWVTLLYFLCQAVSLLIIFHPMTNSEWAALHYFFARHSHQLPCHPMTNSMWVILLYFFCWQAVSSHPLINSMWETLLHFFARQSHQPCLIPWLTECERHCFISLPGSLINLVSFHDQQDVRDTASWLF